MNAVASGGDIPSRRHSRRPSFIELVVSPSHNSSYDECDDTKIESRHSSMKIITMKTQDNKIMSVQRVQECA